MLRGKSRKVRFVDGIETGAVYLDDQTSKLFEVVEKNIRFHESGRPKGHIKVEFLNGDQTDADGTIDAATIERRIDEGDLRTVPVNLLENPVEAALVCAEAHISDIRGTHGSSHPYNRVDGVETVGEMQAILDLAAEQS